jgi:putative ABC transport system permease protein
MGIALTTAMFHIVDATLIRLLPYRESDHLIAINKIDAKSSLPLTITVRDLELLEEQSEAFERIATYSSSVLVASDGSGDALSVTWCPASLFALLEIEPIVGRSLIPSDNGDPNGPAVLSYGLWLKRFGGGVDVIGKTFRFGRKTFYVVGVMPASFDFPIENSRPTEIWTPFEGVTAGVDGVGDQIVARLRSGVELESVQSRMNSVVQSRQGAQDSAQPIRFTVNRLSNFLNGEVRSAILLFFGLVTSIFLMSLVNLLSLQFVRTSLMQHDIAVRAALGAGRFQQVRQLLFESLVFGVTAGVVGSIVAHHALPFILYAFPKKLPRVDWARIDSEVVVFTVAISLLSSSLVGLFSILLCSQRYGSCLVQKYRNSLGGFRLRQVQNLFVPIQTAAAVILLVSSGLMTKTIWRLVATPIGFDPAQVTTAQIELPRLKYRTESQRQSFFQQALESVGSLPQIEAVSLVSGLPMQTTQFISEVYLGSSPSDASGPFAVRYTVAASEYFRTLQIPIVAGRPIANFDRQGSELIVVINEVLARRFGTPEAALGKILRPVRSSGSWLTVVGVVGNVQQRNVQDVVMPEVFVPYLQASSPASMTLVMRSQPTARLDPTELQQVIRSFNNDDVLREPISMSRFLSDSLLQERIRSKFLGSFAFVAAGLAVLGIYGVAAQFVAYNRHDIAVRVALGAGRREVICIVVRRVMLPVGIGLVGGIAGSLAVVRLISAFLFNMTALTADVYLVTTLLMVGLASVATYLPARRAHTANTFEGLRSE